MQIFITTPGITYDFMRIAYASPGLSLHRLARFPFKLCLGTQQFAQGWISVPF